MRDNSEIFNYQKIRQFGLSDEYFFSLPYECQRAILMAGVDKVDNRKKLLALEKRIALGQYNLEEKVKEKILTLFKKK